MVSMFMGVAFRGRDVANGGGRYRGEDAPVAAASRREPVSKQALRRVYLMIRKIASERCGVRIRPIDILF
jgi:hypothetical protein